MNRPDDDQNARNGAAEPFEKGITRLEQIAVELEEGELTLDQSLALFEEGVALSRRLEARLGAAEMRVEQLLSDDGAGERIVPFDEPTDPEE